METLFVFLLFLISVTARSYQDSCPPPPGVSPNCELFPLSRRVADCRTIGCPAGKVCCPGFCSEYNCVSPYTGPTRMCGPAFRSGCSKLTSGRDECSKNSDCPKELICCLVNCRNQCVTGWPIMYQ